SHNSPAQSARTERSTIPESGSWCAKRMPRLRKCRLRHARVSPPWQSPCDLLFNFLDVTLRLRLDHVLRISVPDQFQNSPSFACNRRQAPMELPSSRERISAAPEGIVRLLLRAQVPPRCSPLRLAR